MLFLHRHERARLGLRFASVRTRAGDAGGFRVTHQGLTSGAIATTNCIALVRTSGQHGDRTRASASCWSISRRRHHIRRSSTSPAGTMERGDVSATPSFRELPDRQRGRWLAARDSELAFEAPAGTFLQNFYILRGCARAGPPAAKRPRRSGPLIARLWTLRQMSVAVAGMMQGASRPPLKRPSKKISARSTSRLAGVARVLAESDATTRTTWPISSTWRRRHHDGAEYTIQAHDPGPAASSREGGVAMMTLRSACTCSSTVPPPGHRGGGKDPRVSAR